MGEIWRIFPYSVQMRENTDQKNCEYGHFSRSKPFILENQNILIINLNFQRAPALPVIT